ncbi:MAG: hypothetical protein VX589_08120 [Myxococcota bacterium]|nr:hypothetical protein [Myxococcota bacterium]
MKDTLKQWQAFVPFMLCAAYIAVDLVYESRPSSVGFVDLLLMFLFVGIHADTLRKQHAQFEARIAELETRLTTE